MERGADSACDTKGQDLNACDMAGEDLIRYVIHSVIQILDVIRKGKI